MADGAPNASDILLVSCYELGHAPLGIAWPQAFLRRRGLAARTLDLAVEPFDAERVRAARVVAVAMPMHTALRLGVEACRRIRAENTAAHVVAHGLYAWMNAALLLDGVVDTVVGGEAEETLAAVAQAVLRGEDPHAVPGATGPGRAARPVLSHLDFPAPVRDGLPPPSRYAAYRDGARTFPAAYAEASRGCLHRCRHCPVVPVYGGRFFAVPVEVVLEDVASQVAAGARHVTFGDPDFLNGPTHALRVARTLHQRFPELSFDFTAKVEHLLRHRALLPELRANGATFVVSAVESLSDRVLERLDKGHTAADVDEVLRACDAASLALHPTLVPFTPWTTLDDYLRLVEFFRARGLVRHVPPVQLSIRLLLPPGSPLLESSDAPAWLGTFVPEALTYVWTHPDPRMDALQAAVAARVAAAEERDEDPVATWEAVRALAYAAAARAVPGEARPPSFRPDPPRLTEHWFC